MDSDGEESWSDMTAIERVRWIHARFIENNAEKSFQFKRDCAMELGMKGFGKREDQAVITAHDNYFQLAYKTGEVWQFVEKLFAMWDNGEVKGQKDEADMHLTTWRHLQGLYNKEIVVPVLQKVVLRKLSLPEMGMLFANYKLRRVVQQAFVKGLEEETWSTRKANLSEHVNDNIVKEFMPLFKGWKDSSSRKKRPWNAELPSFPELFNAHVHQAWTWFRMQHRARAAEKEAGKKSLSD